MNAHDIEAINENNWIEATSALCQAAMFYETQLVRCLEQCPELVEEIIVPHLDLVEMSTAVLKHWQQFLEITDDAS